jgi:hypothetical protein
MDFCCTTVLMWIECVKARISQPEELSIARHIITHSVMLLDATSHARAVLSFYILLPEINRVYIKNSPCIYIWLYVACVSVLDMRERIPSMLYVTRNSVHILIFTEDWLLCFNSLFLFQTSLYSYKSKQFTIIFWLLQWLGLVQEWC